MGARALWFFTGGTLFSINVMVRQVLLDEYNELTYKVISCAMTVHRKLGRGFPEIVYQRALGIELFKQSVNSEREVELPIYYENEKVGSRRADFFVENRLLVEMKAVEFLLPVHHVQIINYLEAFRMPVGLLLNFGAGSLEFKRFVKTPK